MIISQNATLTQQFTVSILECGFQPFPVAQTGEEIKPVDGCEVAFLDTDGIDNTVELVRALVKPTNNRILNIVVITDRTDQGFITRLIESGTSGFIPKPIDETRLTTQINAVMEKLSRQNTARKHIRVQPSSEDMLRVSFLNPRDRTTLSATVLDISLGGLAIDLLVHHEKVPTLEIGQHIPEITIALGGRMINPSCSIINQQGKLIAMRFTSLSYQEKSILARYIFKKTYTL